MPASQSLSSSSGVKAVLYATSRHGGSTTTVFINIHHVYLPMMQVNCTIGFLDSCWKLGKKMAQSPSSSRSIQLILSDLQRHIRAKSPSAFNIFQKDDHGFRNFRATCDTVFKKLLADGVGALVKHHTQQLLLSVFLGKIPAAATLSSSSVAL